MIAVGSHENRRSHMGGTAVSGLNKGAGGYWGGFRIILLHPVPQYKPLWFKWLRGFFGLPTQKIVGYEPAALGDGETMRSHDTLFMTPATLEALERMGP